MKQSVIISPTKGVTLYITGEYSKGRDVKWTSFGESEPAEPSEFEIDEIESLEKDLFHLMEWVDAQEDYLYELEALCINKIEEDE
jgi:hypothetical protein